MDPLSAELQRLFVERLAKARAGSSEDFDELVRPFQVVLRRRARKRMERRLQAKFSVSDLFQTTTLKAFEDLHEFRGCTFAEFGEWLLGIMNHTISEQSRKYHRPSRDIAREIPLERMKSGLAFRGIVGDEDEQSGLLKQLLDHLPEPYRQILRLRYYENCSYEEIGQRIRRTADATKHLCYRAEQKLAEEWRKQKGK
jgi:RNA polymerase sigma-70 factor (ECF subfamily)